MVGTLIKYEWQRTRTTLLMFIGICIVVILVGWAGRQAGVAAIAALGVVTEVVGLLALLFAPMLLIVLDYARSSYLRVGYFTQTLPVKGSTIFWVKFCFGLVVWSVSLAFAVLLFFGTSLFMTWDALVGFLKQTPTSWLVAGTVFLIVVLACYLATFFGSVTIGYDPKFLRLGNAGSLVGFVIIYLAGQLVGMALLTIPLALTKSDAKVGIVRQWFWRFGSDAAGFAGDNLTLPIGVVAIPVVLLVMLLTLLVHCWQHRVSLR